MSFSSAKLKAQVKSQNAKKIMDMLTTKCADCGATSGQRRLYKLEEGTICNHCATLRGYSIPEIMDAEAKYKDFLQSERDKPKPENYGEWA